MRPTSLPFRGGPSLEADRGGVKPGQNMALRAMTPPGSHAAAWKSALP
jgi:hypothetical protein